MCYSPIKIVNPTKDFRPSLDPVYLQVPCGRCAECLAIRQSDWLVRAYFEYKACSDAGGTTLFVTFTYNNENLPHFTLNGKTYACFYRPDYTRFMDLFRKRLTRRFGVDKGSVKVFWTSEYGGKTHRPHYHALIFIYDKISVSSIKHQIYECWPYGFINYGKFGGVVNSISAVKYVSKYVTKDLDFYDNLNSHDLEVLKKDYPDTYKFFRSRVFPFHCNSQGFGLKALDYLSQEMIESGEIIIPDTSGGYYRKVKLPLYLDRKKYCYVDPDTNSYKYTYEGVDVMCRRRKEYEQKRLQEHISLFEDIAINGIDEKFMPDINYVLGRDYIPSDITSIYRDFLNNYTLQDFLTYNENRYLLTVDDTQFPEPTVFTEFPTYKERLSKHLHPHPIHSDYGVMRWSGRDLRQLERIMVCTNYPDLEAFTRVHDAVRFAVGRSKQLEADMKYQEYSNAKKVKDIYNMY